MNKRRATVITVSVATLTLLALPASSSAKKVTITYWEKWGGFEQKMIQSLVDRFNKSQNRIEVKYSLEPGAAFEKYLTACAAGNPPDIVGGWNHRLAPYVMNSVAEPLDKYLKLMGISQKDFIPSYWDMMNYKGKIYGVPVTPACFAEYWNKTMFAEAGLNPEVGPATLEEIMAVNNKLTKKDANGRVKQIGYSPTIPGWYPYWWPVAFGADLVNEAKGSIDMSQPGYLKAMEWVKNISAQLGGDKGVSSVGDGFLKQKTAIDLIGSWNPSYLLKQAPSIKYGIAPLPYGQSGSEWSWLEADVLFMPKSGKHNKEAAEFMKFMMSPAVQREFQLQRETFSVMKAINTQDFIKENKNPGIAQFVKIANSRRGGYTPKITIWADLDSAIYGTMFTSVWTGKKAPAQAIKDAQAAADVIIKRKWKLK